VAGSETTANSLEFAILYMIRYPAVQEKVRDEIDRIIGRNKFPHSVNKPE
jgi:cytochrome P450